MREQLLALVAGFLSDLRGSECSGSGVARQKRIDAFEGEFNDLVGVVEPDLPSYGPGDAQYMLARQLAYDQNSDPGSASYANHALMQSSLAPNGEAETAEDTGTELATLGEGGE